MSGLTAGDQQRIDCLTARMGLSLQPVMGGQSWCSGLLPEWKR
jgi:hypothetical protein